MVASAIRLPKEFTIYNIKSCIIMLWALVKHKYGSFRLTDDSYNKANILHSEITNWHKC